MGNLIKVGIATGDYNGIGYEVIIKSLRDERIFEQFIPVVYGSSKIFSFYKKNILGDENLNTNLLSSFSDLKPKSINIVNCTDESVFVNPGVDSQESAKAAFSCLKRAVEDIKQGNIDVLVTAPFNKALMSKSGFSFPGHTEFLSSEFATENVTMFMVNENIRIAVLTGHIPLSEVPAQISASKIVSKLDDIRSSLEMDFGCSSYKIAVLGLNPHSSDNGLLGNQENEIIIPAIKQANEKGINAFGPFAADGFFGSGLYMNFDAILAMYHDQGLIPFKTLVKDGVNFTAGLPVVRTSPAHGTAFEIAGKWVADSESMTASIYTAIDIFKRRKQYEALRKGKLETKNTFGQGSSSIVE